MFIAAQFTIAKYWKQPKCPSANEWIPKLWYIYTLEFYSAERERRSLYPLWQHGWQHGTGEHYAKWNKPGSEGQIPYDLTWNIFKLPYLSSCFPFRAQCASNLHSFFFKDSQKSFLGETFPNFFLFHFPFPMGNTFSLENVVPALCSYFS